MYISQEKPPLRIDNQPHLGDTLFSVDQDNEEVAYRTQHETLMLSSQGDALIQRLDMLLSEVRTIRHTMEYNSWSARWHRFLVWFGLA